mmetsp:Transcript_11472/g.32294  ORF Transcript_11472/g.32294 Transcript_11472/m.32294 type:complete len:216 (-) Transcript_11472:1054-1701(-)
MRAERRLREYHEVRLLHGTSGSSTPGCDLHSNATGNTSEKAEPGGAPPVPDGAGAAGDLEPEPRGGGAGIVHLQALPRRPGADLLHGHTGWRRDVWQSSKGRPPADGPGARGQEHPEEAHPRGRALGRDQHDEVLGPPTHHEALLHLRRRAARAHRLGDVRGRGALRRHPGGGGADRVDCRQVVQTVHEFGCLLALQQHLPPGPQARELPLVKEG